jgi:hypothetical protein
MEEELFQPLVQLTHHQDKIQYLKQLPQQAEALVLAIKHHHLINLEDKVALEAVAPQVQVFQEDRETYHLQVHHKELTVEMDLAAEDFTQLRAAVAAAQEHPAEMPNKFITHLSAELVETEQQIQLQEHRSREVAVGAAEAARQDHPEDNQDQVAVAEVDILLRLQEQQEQMARAEEPERLTQELHQQVDLER